MKDKTEDTTWIKFWAILSTLVIAIGFILLIRRDNNEYNDNVEYRYIIDSLKREIVIRDSIYNHERDYYDLIIDSLSNKKKEIVIKYNTKYESFKDITIVDDDSITRYISTKIHN